MTLTYIIGYFSSYSPNLFSTGDEKMENYSFNQFSVLSITYSPEPAPQTQGTPGKL